MGCGKNISLSIISGIIQKPKAEHEYDVSLMLVFASC